jgi:hypothetical protein
MAAMLGEALSGSTADTDDASRALTSGVTPTRLHESEHQF